ncbi:hypothetical protein [Enterococcus faecalis]|uniref:hypothetical protein n=1 Tax=Enterococcus faecalis TaxID=1351 RepID=UPI000CF191A6|nr:hypothetical protein [Enterococcus faecalis]PQD24803.1 hypothetical protein CUM75_06715 [Enterococcus faecalis]
MIFDLWRISAYFRRSWFCSRRLSVFERGAKKAEEKSRNFSSAFLNKDVILFVSIRKETYNKEELVE